ncbi:hypothetical protein J4427_03860 [Candidatus Woesearchaeota archaeon]|nr:hypothetical protein [Candidatus Woesearchaeota archaeon]
MKRIEISKKIIGLIKEEDVLTLIKQLEKKGVPAQVRVKIETDVPDDEAGEKGRVVKYFGDFNERPVIVTRVQNLEIKYEHDILLLEGSYESLACLNEKIKELRNPIYSYTSESKLIGKILAKHFSDFIKKRIPDRCQYSPDAFLDLHDGWVHGDERLDLYEVSKILEQEKIKHIQHQISARPDGLYDDRTDFDGIHSTYVDETKIADISLKLIEIF